MGKRELLIALAFIVVGVAAYQLTAPPPKEGEGFSLRQLWNHLRAEIREDSARASVVMSETVEVPAGTAELRLVEMPRGTTVAGEDRKDIAYEFSVESTGPTEAAATETARKSKILRDQFGESLELKTKYPTEGRQRAQLALKVPRHLKIRMQSSSSVTVSSVAAVHLEAVSGDSKLLDIAGTISGTHSGGELEVKNAGTLKLTLQGSDARLDGISGGGTIDSRASELRVTGSKGALDVNVVNNQMVLVSGHAGPVRIVGSGGRVEFVHPSEESRVDMRRAEVDVTLHAAVALVLSTTDETLRLILENTPAIAIDALATEAKIDAAAFSLQGTSNERGQQLTHQFATHAAARVSIRNLRGDIVIDKMK